jgi:hypothetical protein
LSVRGSLTSLATWRAIVSGAIRHNQLQSARNQRAKSNQMLHVGSLVTLRAPMTGARSGGNEAIQRARAAALDFCLWKQEHARPPGGEVVPRGALLDYNQSCMLPASAIDGTPCTNGWKCSAYRHFHSAIQNEIPRMEHAFQGPCCCFPVAPSHSATLVASRGHPISRPSTICHCRLVAVVRAELNPALVANEACEAIRR